MKIALVTDAWQPQVNGVVTTLVELVSQLEKSEHEIRIIHPGLFKTRPCPGYAGIDLAIRPYAKLTELLHEFQPDAVHLATEGPLGWAGRRYCLRQQWPFTTAFHTKFPEILHAALRIPISWSYALFRHFHRPSRGVMVPTQGVLNMLSQRGFVNLKPWSHGVDSSLFEYAEQAQEHPLLEGLMRPIALFVGRVSYEKNIREFLTMPWPGSKVVCGEGPVLSQLKREHPQTCWMGVLQRPELAKIYASADVFVFPSRSETFGLVMLEAMACGTPVAAFPVDGPLQVLEKHNEQQQRLGGVLHPDLRVAALEALNTPRLQAYQRSLDFNWQSSTDLFLSFLVRRRPVVG